MVSKPKRILSREFFDAIKRIAHPDHLQQHPHLRRFFATFDPRLVGEAYAMHPSFFDFAEKGRRLHFIVDDELGYEITCAQWMESVVRVDLNAGTVCKSIGPKYRDFGIWDREIGWLRRLQSTDIVPELIEATAERIVTRYLGEPVSQYTLPDDWRDQAEQILAVLSEHGCAHNDIAAGNLVIADGRMRLIDFAWALPIGTPVPEHWPEELGRHRVASHQLDDRYAIFEALSEKENLALAETKAAQQQQQPLKPPAPAAPPRQ
jgi:hypothetical protein